MRNVRPVFVVCLLLLFVAGASFALPEWVESFGTETPYDGARYITGFSMYERSGNDNEAMEAAKTGALDDLIRKVQVRVKSSITATTDETDSSSSSSVSIVSRSVSNLQLTGVDFLFEKDFENYYALAYVNKADLRRYYIDNGKRVLEELVTLEKRAETYERDGEIGPAMEIYIRMLPLFPALMEYSAIFRVLALPPAGRSSAGGQVAETGSGPAGGRPGFFDALDIAGHTNSSIIELEKTVQDKVKTLEKSETADLEAALDKIAVILRRQGVRGGGLTVPALLYKQTDFSSTFGSYAARKLESLLTAKLPSGGNKTVVRGNYWENDDTIELFIVAQEVDSGGKIGAGYASFPRATLPHTYDIKPQNFAQAMEDRFQFADGAITDGGITVEVWTNKGRDDDNLVFTEGDWLQLYFRVNRPAFLQLTYNLATGAKVLLEKSFYIGINEVNRVVQLPYEFEVVPPLGVERLIVTAFSEEPPRPNTRIALIDGEQYEVFTTTRGIVAQTRGLKKKQETTDGEAVKVGEAMVTLTTVPDVD